METNVLERINPATLKDGDVIEAGPLLASLSNEPVLLICLGPEAGVMKFDALYNNISLGKAEWSVEGGWAWKH